MSFDLRDRALLASGTVLIASACALAYDASSNAHAAAGIAYGTLALSGLLGTVLAWERRGRTAFIVILAVALAARIILCASPPLFSHDAYRYLWDAGHPYRSRSARARSE